MSKNILVTGATGYIGGRLVPRLLERGYNVRLLVRDRRRIADRNWEGVETVEGDALEYKTLLPAMKDIDTAYYLIHSMASGEKQFVERDRKAATNFGRAASRMGVSRIVYLGGPGRHDDELSPHLQSRQETGRCLRVSGVPVTEFRAGVIVGSGSLSFELIRYVTERIPILFCPPEIKTKAQPIGIRDVMRYLIDCLQIPETMGRIIEIGGRDVLSYADMIKTYARIRGLPRHIIVVPFLTPELISYPASLVTPMPFSIVKPVLAGLKNMVVCADDTAHQLFGFKPLRYEQNLQLALMRIEAAEVETVWSDAYSSSWDDVRRVELVDYHGMLIERRQHVSYTTPDRVFEQLNLLGGGNGWPYGNLLWRIRGLWDRMSGGVGLRRPRRHPHQLRIGDAVDFWRVEAVEKNRLLRLRGEMRVSGRAWLQFELDDAGKNKTLVTQTAFFEPRGLRGYLYWYWLYPFHRYLFAGMVKAIARRAENSN